ncbi:MAG: glutathione S-transferase family protein [Parvibaculum sp.]|uniref:glutathione S-transferase family protein n=1 Tax=Parvibaculum sp. TaxID=2024848 RepID=UPI003264356A
MSIQTGMKMYNSQLSPFAARCRLAIYAKDLDVELLDMPDPALEAEFSRLAPMHKVPLLVDGETVVPESETICEYLEDRGLGTSLRPDDPVTTARMRLLSRIGDLYVMDPMGELFGQINPAGRDAQLVAREMAELSKAMGWVEHYIDGPDFAVGDRLTLADCEMVPVLFFFDQIGPMFGYADPLRDYPRAQAYYKGIQKTPAAAKVVAELDAALRRMMGN